MCCNSSVYTSLNTQYHSICTRVCSLMPYAYGTSNFRCLKQICAYADDIVIIGRTKQVVIDAFCKLKHEMLNAGLTVNNNKTKYLHSSRKIFQPMYLSTGGEEFEQVNSFKYLGSTVNTDNSVEEEIKERKTAGNRAYHVHRKLFTSNLISRNV